MASLNSVLREELNRSSLTPGHCLTFRLKETKAQWCFCSLLFLFLPVDDSVSATLQVDLAIPSVTRSHIAYDTQKLWTSLTCPHVGRSVSVSPAAGCIKVTSKTFPFLWCGTARYNNTSWVFLHELQMRSGSVNDKISARVGRCLIIWAILPNPKFVPSSFLPQLSDIVPERLCCKGSGEPTNGTDGCIISERCLGGWRLCPTVSLQSASWAELEAWFLRTHVAKASHSSLDICRVL